MKTTRNDNFKDSRALKNEDENHKEKYKKTDTVKVKTDAINTNLVKVNTFRVTSRSVNSLFLLLRTFVSEVLVSVFVLLSVLACVCAKEQKFALEPQDQSALVGSRVTLPCRVVNKVGQLQWTKDDFGLGTHRHLIGYERYKMVGSDEEGDYSLDIRDVTLDDDALYQCQVSSGPKGEQPIRSRYAHLIVLMPPDPPKILQAPTLQTIEDRDVDLECISTGGKPAAEITWVDSEGGVLTQGVTYNVEPMSDGRRFTARSILRLRPRRHHHNQTLTCQAQNTADRAYRSATIRLEVQYAPKVRVFIKSPLKRMISEGENLIISCQASANPNNLTYKWYVNNEQIEGKTDNELVLRNISRKYNEATVKCEVYNSVGKSADTKSLEIAYGPSIKESPQNVEGELGSLAILNCLVDGHPQPKIMWLRYENERVIRVGKSSNLTLTITQQSAGQYWCRGSVEGHQDVEAMAMVYLRGPPKIISNETQYGVIGDSVKIECISFSVPKPDYIVWSYEGQEINSFHNQEYAFLEEALADKLTKSTLIIRRSETRHYGPYNCTVANSYGTDSILINILPDKSLPIIFIVSGCSSTAIILVMVMLIIMLFHRKTKSEKKPDITDVGKTCPDRFKDSDRNSNVSDLKLELRQVEGNCDLEHSNGGSVTDLHPTTRLTSNLGLPLAGPVTLPDVGHDNELMKQYQRYSGDFNQAINNLNFKAHGQSNGYVPYVDYTRDYAPPDSLSGSLTRSVHGSEYPSQCSSLHRQASCGRIAGVVGPDVIPMNPGMMSAGIDVRYAATYGNPYLRGSGSISYVPQANPNSGAKHPPPPYYSIRNSSLHVPGSVSSPSSSLSSRPSTSPLASASSTNSSAQPQVPKPCPQSENLYIRPHTSQGNSVNNQITCKGSQTAGTHV